MASKALTGTALITGAGSGVGKASAFAFAEAGAKGIVFADVDEHAAHEAAKESKMLAKNPQYHAVVVKVDVTQESSVVAMVERTIKEFGRIDYSVNSAGIGLDTHEPIINSTVEEYDKLNNINNRGMMLCIREVTRAMVKQESIVIQSKNGERRLGKGSIVNLGSSNSCAAFPGYLPYTASKHAVIGLTKTAALDNIQQGIRVNAVCPSWVDTPMMQREFEKVPTLLDTIKRMSPAGRMALPEEVADTVLFLCSPAASYVNGAILMVDSGSTLTAHLG